LTQVSGGAGSTKRIVIMSASFGGPHRLVAEALAAYYRERYPGEVEARVLDFLEEFVPSANVLARFAYTQPAAFFPTGSGSLGDLVNRLPSNPVLDELKATGSERVADFLSASEPDAVVSTLPIAGAVVSETRPRSDMVSATVITDYRGDGLWLQPATDLYFVPCNEVREDLVVKGVAWNRIVTSGVAVNGAFARRIDQTSCRRDLGLSERFTALFSASAGSVGDVRGVAEDLAAAGIQVVVLTGSNRRLRTRLESLTRSQPLVQVFGYSEEMNKMMGAADVFVGRAGGLMVSEALATGTPVIISSPVPGQELGNVDFLVNYGAGLAARDEADVVEKVRFLSTHPDRLEQMADNAGRLGKPAAAASVCERVLAAVR
jgi:processive 1,2-diacylglycerol beta-glucosyltransferase